LQMKSGLWNQNWNTALCALAERDLLTATELELAVRSYDFLRACETVLRRWENKSVSLLPADPDEQYKLARRVGCRNSDEFAKQYKTARDSIHALYERHIRSRAN
jgi:glutamine synthetase adenylyltransferase